MRTDDRFIISTIFAFLATSVLLGLLIDTLPRSMIVWFFPFNFGCVFITVFGLIPERKFFRHLANTFLALGIYLMLVPSLTEFVGCYLLWLWGDPFTRVGYSFVGLGFFYYTFVSLKGAIPKLQTELRKEIEHRRKASYRKGGPNGGASDPVPSGGVN